MHNTGTSPREISADKSDEKSSENSANSAEISREGYNNYQILNGNSICIKNFFVPEFLEIFVFNSLFLNLI